MKLLLVAVLFFMACDHYECDEWEGLIGWASVATDCYDGDPNGFWPLDPEIRILPVGCMYNKSWPNGNHSSCSEEIDRSNGWVGTRTCFDTEYRCFVTYTIIVP